MRVVVKEADHGGGEVRYIAEHLRTADRQELETASGVSAEEARSRAWGLSQNRWVALVDDLPAFVFGVVNDPARGLAGVIWMVCTDRIARAPRGVLRTSQECLDEIAKHFDLLHNQADCRNTLHLRWIKKLGFTLDDIVQVNGLPFQRFHLTRKEARPCANP